MFTRSDRLRPNTKFNRFLGTESDKSLIDDLYLTESCKHESKLVLRSAEGKLLSEDLYLRGQQCHAPPHNNNNNTPNVYNKQNKTNNKPPKQNNTPILINTKRNSTPPSLFINITNTHVTHNNNRNQQPTILFIPLYLSRNPDFSFIKY